ncbi:MAG: endonuclease/exonuclease/phosphatase family protein [Candidatus Brocadiia bacterium]
MRKIFIYASILIIPVLFLFCAPAGLRKIQEPTGPHIKVLTWNVNWGMPQPSEALKVLQDAGADIICLQETTPAWERFLRPQLGKDYPFMEFRHRNAAGGQAIFSKRPFKELEYILPAEGWFPGWFNEFETDIGTIQILSVHLHPAISDKGSFSVGAYLSTPKIRLGEIQTLFPHLKKETATLILGDFNEEDSSVALEWLVEQGFTNALGEFDSESQTWEWQSSFMSIKRRFDHVLYSKELTCPNAYVNRTGGSDHFPVFAVFEKAK